MSNLNKALKQVEQQPEGIVTLAGFTTEQAELVLACCLAFRLHGIRHDGTTYYKVIESSKAVVKAEPIPEIVEGLENVQKMQKPLTAEQAQKLTQKYGAEPVRETLEAMENTAQLRKKYTSAYLTCNQWIKYRRGTNGNGQQTTERVNANSDGLRSRAAQYDDVNAALKR